MRVKDQKVTNRGMAPFWRENELVQTQPKKKKGLEAE